MIFSINFGNKTVYNFVITQLKNIFKCNKSNCLLILFKIQNTSIKLSFSKINRIYRKSKKEINERIKKNDDMLKNFVNKS